MDRRWVEPSTLSRIAPVAMATVFVVTAVSTAEAQRRPRWPSENGAAFRAIPAVRTLPAVRANLSTRQPLARPVTAVDKPVEPLLGVVSINRQTVTFYNGIERIAEAPISSGQAGHRTPTGVFSVIQKARYHESNIYSGAPMPFMQRITWSGIALHAGNLPGYPASHGCIRLPHEFAERLFAMTRIGARIVVAPDPVAPVSIAHDHLPLPMFTEIAEPAPAPAVASALSAVSVATAVVPSAAAAPASASLMSPRKAAEHEKRRAGKAVVELQQAAKESLRSAALASAAAEDAKNDIRFADDAVAAYRDVLRRAHAMIAAAVTDEDQTQGWASLAVAEEALADAVRSADSARRSEVAAADHALALAIAARKAEDAAIAAEEHARIAARGVEPLTVFVSRKENRAYLRQGLSPLMEGDVTIADLLAPIGTHVFTAIASDESGATLAWNALTVPETGMPQLPASAALSRIAFAPQLADEIARRLWVGATIIVSDHAISGETGKGTDFIVLTK